MTHPAPRGGAICPECQTEAQRIAQLESERDSWKWKAEHPMNPTALSVRHAEERASRLEAELAEARKTWHSDLMLAKQWREEAERERDAAIEQAENAGDIAGGVLAEKEGQLQEAIAGQAELVRLLQQSCNCHDPECFISRALANLPQEMREKLNDK